MSGGDSQGRVPRFVPRLWRRRSRYAPVDRPKQTARVRHYGSARKRASCLPVRPTWFVDGSSLCGGPGGRSLGDRARLQLIRLNGMAHG